MRQSLAQSHSFSPRISGGFDGYSLVSALALTDTSCAFADTVETSWLRVANGLEMIVMDRRILQELSLQIVWTAIYAPMPILRLVRSHSRMQKKVTMLLPLLSTRSCP